VNAGTWVLLGTYTFTAGGHAVDLSNDHTKVLSNEYYVMGDAVMFEPAP